MEIANQHYLAVRRQGTGWNFHKTHEKENYPRDDIFVNPALRHIPESLGEKIAHTSSGRIDWNVHGVVHRTATGRRAKTERFGGWSGVEEGSEAAQSSVPSAQTEFLMGNDPLVTDLPGAIVYTIAMSGSRPSE